MWDVKSNFNVYLIILADHDDWFFAGVNYGRYVLRLIEED